MTIQTAKMLLGGTFFFITHGKGHMAKGKGHRAQGAGQMKRLVALAFGYLQAS